MIWYAVEVVSVPTMVERTICDINDALNNIKFPIDSTEMMQLVDNWSAKHRDHHGFATNKGTALAVDGFVMETRCKGS